MKSHLQSYPCPLQINSFWNLGFLLGITILLQIITGIFLGLHYTSDLNSAYSSLFFLIREIFYGWCLRYLHSSGASFVFLFLFLHFGRAITYGSYFYNPNTWFSGIIIFFFLMATAFMGYVFLKSRRITIHVLMRKFHYNSCFFVTYLSFLNW
jgi:quinol-cytochrome oxidoreductase complex cytochrome b subunit